MISSKTYACHYIIDLANSKGSYHRRHAPDIGTCSPFGAQDDFWRAVLSGLDVVCEVMSHPTSVPKICNFDRDGVHSLCYIFLACFLWRGSLVEGNTGYSLRKVLATFSSARLRCAGKGAHLRSLFLVFLIIVGAVGRNRICKAEYLPHRLGRCSGNCSTSRHNAVLRSR